MCLYTLYVMFNLASLYLLYTHTHTLDILSIMRNYIYRLSSVYLHLNIQVKDFGVVQGELI